MTLIKGDQKIVHALTLKQKALQINLNSHIYGTFAEIGAGQETVRHFFRAGGASGTIAKAMSAYDKVFSDEIYGSEEDKRYVTESRLRKMLHYEIDLIEDRLNRKDHPDKIFFSYANTVTTIDFAKKFKGHGWVGIRFQMDPLEDYNEIVIHARFKQTDSRLQQETLGMLGVNLIYGAFYMNENPKELLKSFYDNIESDTIEIDMVDFSGPRFMYVDNRLMSLYLVKNGMTNAVMFDPNGNNLLPAHVLYKKNILALRGSFRPVTKVNMEIYEESKKLFLNENRVDEKNTRVIFEITLANLRSEGGKINERDFLDRAEILCSLGQTVMITNFQEYYKLVDYFSEFTKARMALAMGVINMIEIFDEKYYRDLSGGILEAFGKLFYKDLKVYLYPLKDPETGEIIDSKNLKVHPRLKELYKYFKSNGRIIDIENYDLEILDYYSRSIFKMISKGEEGWEEMVPEGVPELIKSHRLFGYKKRTSKENRKK
ncbi:MAG: TonB-dependent receptor [Flavobacteriia bacterium]|nr:MAG: TonB-dependent receptor [Flavobacteriia bacterium]